ncbi:MAG: four helix bundle protein [Elusimicrobia bacterium]|nr:four helix bundle protein [Elusimicrobiota bacterium]
MQIKSVRDLDVYKLAFNSAMEIFETTKLFPKDEKYSLVDQIVRSSRSVCSNLAEAWRKRRYILAFRNKLTDAMQEASETQTWLEFCFSCKYIPKSKYEKLFEDYEHILAMLNNMEMKAKSFCFLSSQSRNFIASQPQLKRSTNE